MPIRTLVWGENVHEQKNQVVADNYPQGMHNQIASLLGQDPNIVTRTTTLQDPEHGCTESKR
jgi:trehalose utilization protein